MQQNINQNYSPCEQIQGIVERLTYHSSESGYTVARLKVPRANDLITIVGNFISIQPGQTLQLSGVWRENPKFGAEFQVSGYRELKPATITGIEKYLGSGLIKGVGPVTAKRIVAHFGLETLEIIENQIDRLSEVPGIAKKRINLIREAWITQKAIKDVMLFLQTHGVSTTYAVKIYKQYREESIEIVTENPYRLAIDVYGIGFTTADTIARNLGITPNSEFRYRSCILHILSEAAEEGHCFLPETELVERSTQSLKIPEHEPKPHQVQFIIRQMVADEELFKTEKLIEPLKEFGYYAAPFYYAERKLAKKLKELLKQRLEVDLPRVQQWIDRFTVHTGISLSEQQRQAVELAASQRVVILTGGPGTGKTFTTRTIVELWKAMGKTIAASSPTGRAAQRLSELTGQEAKTLHRLLEFDPKTGRFKRDQENPIPAQAIVVDEISMLDLFLANSLIKAVPLDAQLLLIGDVDQLPSVGPGKVLADLIASQKVPVIRLTQVFRQASSSKIIAHAHAINQGHYPILESVSKTPVSDCLWFAAPEPEHGLEAIRVLVTDLIPSWGFNPATDVQVLSPVTKGQTGTRNLNAIQQKLLNRLQRSTHIWAIMLKSM